MSAPSIAARYAHQLAWDEIDPAALHQLILQAQAEDLTGWGLARPPSPVSDPGTWLNSRKRLPAHASATIVSRTELVAAGLPLISPVLQAYGGDCQAILLVEDGQPCAPGQALARLEGPPATLLRAERVLLNFLQRLCGVASLTRTYVDVLGTSATRLLDTRKTTPGLRVLEKYAAARGGGYTHRMGLFDRVMLKDNHLAAARAQTGPALHELLTAFREAFPQCPLQLEVDTVDQIQPALDAGIECLLLDNFSTPDLAKAVALTADRCATEASGTITLKRLPELRDLGLDFISTGATIHQATWKDLSLEWK